MSKEQATQLQQAAESFYLDCEIRHLTPATLIWYRKYVGALVTWLQSKDVTAPKGITLDLLRAYIAELQGKDFAQNTVHHHASAAKVFCGFLTDEGLLTDNPALRLKRPKIPKQVLPALSQAEVKKLLDTCETERDKALLLFMLDTGARCSETVAVNVGDMDTKTGAVTIRKGKGQKGRMVYLGVRARKALLRYIMTRENAGANDALWVSLTTGNRLTVWGVNQALQRLGDMAEVHVHPHKLRRSFAIWSLRAGMDVARVAALLGHSDLQVVQGYLAIVESDLQTAHREHGAVDAIFDRRGDKS